MDCTENQSTPAGSVLPVLLSFFSPLGLVSCLQPKGASASASRTPVAPWLLLFKLRLAEAGGTRTGSDVVACWKSSAGTDLGPVSNTWTSFQEQERRNVLVLFAAIKKPGSLTGRRNSRRSGGEEETSPLLTTLIHLLILKTINVNCSTVKPVARVSLNPLWTLWV